jgi:hypothetical protein
MSIDLQSKYSYKPKHPLDHLHLMVYCYTKESGITQ